MYFVRLAILSSICIHHYALGSDVCQINRLPKPFDFSDGDLCGSRLVRIQERETSLVLNSRDTNEMKVASIDENQWDYEAMWILFPNTDGTFFIVDLGKGNCLDLQQGNCKDGTRIFSYQCFGGNSQKWHINGNGSITNYCSPMFGLRVNDDNTVVLGDANSNGFSYFNLFASEINF